MEGPWFKKNLIEEEWPPEQIHGWMKENMNISVSHEWIYQYIYPDQQKSGNLHTYLYCKKNYKNRNGAKDQRGQIKNRVSIDDRQSIVEERNRIGYIMKTMVGLHLKSENKYPIYGVHF